MKKRTVVITEDTMEARLIALRRWADYLSEETERIFRKYEDPSNLSIWDFRKLVKLSRSRKLMSTYKKCEFSRNSMIRIMKDDVDRRVKEYRHQADILERVLTEDRDPTREEIVESAVLVPMFLL